MKIILCDDNQKDRAELRKLLTHHLQQQGEQAELVELESGEALLNYMNSDTADLIFLDIYMENLTGIQTARRLRSLDFHGGLILVSSSEDSALASYSVQADYYLLKPVSIPSLAEAIAVFLQKNQHRQALISKKLNILCKHQLVSIPVLTILYIEVYNRVLLVHCLDYTYETYGTLKYMREQLGSSFFQVHRSYLVNRNFIQDYAPKALILTNGIKVPVSRRYTQSTADAYQDFLNHQLWGEEQFYDPSGN